MDHMVKECNAVVAVAAVAAVVAAAVAAVVAAVVAAAAVVLYCSLYSSLELLFAQWIVEEQYFACWKYLFL